MRFSSFFWVHLALLASLISCSGESASDPGPANAVTDALYQSLRDSIVQEFERNELDSAFSDSLFQNVYDSVYQAEVRQIQAQYDSLSLAHYDSLQLAQDSIAIRQRTSQDSLYEVRDSLQALSIAAAADSIYTHLYEQIYEEIYSSSAAKNIHLLSWTYHPVLSPADYPYLKTLYGTDDPQAQLLTLTLTNVGTQTYYKIVVETEVPGFTQVQATTEIINVEDTVTVQLSPALLYAAWSNLTAPRSAQLNYRIKVLNNDKEILVHSESIAINVHPANMRPGFYTRKDGASVDMYSYNALWVQPQADSVQAVVESARQLHAEKTLAGYQDPGNTGNHATITRDQVQAIYAALQARDIGYVTSADLGNAGQVVLFPNQTLRHRFANCIDGSVLFASALERIGLEVAIVTIPGHAFIGYRTWENASTWEFIETTLAWNGSTFAQALAQGNAKYNSQVTANNFTNGTSHITKITDARKLGYAAYPYDLEF